MLKIDSMELGARPHRGGDPEAATAQFYSIYANLCDDHIYENWSILQQPWHLWRQKDYILFFIENYFTYFQRVLSCCGPRPSVEPTALAIAPLRRR